MTTLNPPQRKQRAAKAMRCFQLPAGPCFRAILSPRALLRFFVSAVVVSSVVHLSGCAKPAGPVFEPLATPLHWPAPPERPRIEYLGALATDRDLKPGRSFLESVEQLLFGERPIEAMASPMAISSDGGSRIFICDTGGRLVHVYDLESRRYEQWQPMNAFASPVGVAWDHGSPDRENSRLGTSGRLFVTDSAAGTIHVFDERGTPLGEIGAEHLVRPTGIAIDPQHARIFIADSAAHEIIVLDMRGNVLHRLGTRGAAAGEFNFPTSVAWNRVNTHNSELRDQSFLFVSDSLNFRVQVFDHELNFVGQIGERGNTPGHFSNPKGLALDSDGHVYIVDAHFEAVQIFDEQGRLLLVFGNEGRGPGEFWLPAGLHIDHKDRIWVADSYNRRVQVFQYLKEAQE